MKRRIIAALMALCLCIGLLPATALAVEGPGEEDFVTVEYTTGGPLTKSTLVIEVYDNNGRQLDTIICNDVYSVAQNIKISLTDAYKNLYDIEDVAKVSGDGTFTSKTISADLCSFDTTSLPDTSMTVAVYLCQEFERPDVTGDEFATGTTQYRIYDAQILKMLYLNGDTSVNADTEIESVQMRFVDSSGNGWPYEETEDFQSPTASGAGRNSYRWLTLGSYGDMGEPGNIRYLEIRYNNGGEDQTARIYSDQLRYVNDQISLVENHCIIEANDDTVNVVAFYSGHDGSYALYHLVFVEDGDSVGASRMPTSDPTYTGEYVFVNWDYDEQGGDPFLPSDVITEDTDLYSRVLMSESSGTQFRVMNDEGRLMERIVEMYNADLAEGEEPITADEIVMDSIDIVITGNGDTSTVPQKIIYGWDEEYFTVSNTTIYDGHIPANQVNGMYVTFQLVDSDETQMVSFDRGIGAEDFSVSVLYTGATDNVTAIILNDDPTPLTPDGALEILAQGAVQVTCTNSDAGHGSRTSGLISGTFDVGNYEYTNSGYVTTITVYPADYVDAFEINNGENIDHGTATPTSQTITLIYTDNREWTVTSTTPVGFSVTCDDEDEDDNFAMQNVYVYAKPIGSGTDGALTEAEEEILKETYGLTLNAKGYCVLGKLENVLLPLASQQDIGQNYYSNYDDVIQAAFAADKFKLHESAADHQDLIKTLDWYHLGVASGADGYENEAPSSGLCWHLDGNLNISAKYKLTYDANGGTIDGSEKHIVNDITTKDPENYTLDTTINPEHADEGTKDVLFAGWTTDVDATGKIYRVEDAKNGSVPAAVDTVDLTVTKTVYALWSYDEDNDGTPDINEIIVTPADITIYTGGSDYEGGIVDEDGNKLAGSDSNGFPEPGFYITLPTALNDQLRGGATGPVDLSEELSFVYEKELGSEAKHWTLKMYNPDTDAESNIAYEKFIYQLEPGDDQDPVRLLITDAAGKEQPSDRFGFDVDTLYQEYTMTIYGGGNVETNEVQAVIEDDTYSVFVDTGDLTVRGVKGEDSTSAVVTEKPEELDKITAVAADDVTYYINDSAIPVRKDAEIHLLADELADTPQALTAAAEKAINGAIVDPEYDFMYLDLVDSSNGNAYVTLNKDGEADGEADTVTIHWPIPDDADPDGKFYVVHFDGLDRDYDVDTELEGLLTDENITVYEKDGTNDLTVSKDGKSVSFETSTFSPFALVYEKTSTPTEQVTVTFKVDNGTWSDGSYRNIVYTINKGTTLASNSIAVPTGMQPESGYTGGSWDTTPNMTTPLNSNVTYTYSFTRSGGGSESDPYLRFDSNGGTEFDPIDENGRDFSINVYDDDHYGTHIPTRPGYRFTGWYTTNTLRTRIDEDEILRVTSYRTVFAGWEETSVPSMLNGDDHYAYIQGYSDGTVRPNANITRAQVATIFFRLLDEDVRDDNLTTYNTFPDVDEDYWANTAISTMASLGVINGRNSGLFDPDAYITRAEFAAICARFDDSGVDGITTFTDTVGHWAEDEISRAAALGWIQGYSDGTFRPNQYITRAQAVTMINRVLCRLPEDTDDLLSGMNTWTDCHEDDWFYLAIQEATNSHDFVAKDRVYESWTDLNRAPDWSRYE